MATDKPARQFTKLTEALHAKDAEIAELKRSILDEQRRSAALSSHALSCAADAKNALARVVAADRCIAELDQLNAAATLALDELDTKHQAATTALRSSEAMRLETVTERNALAARLAEVGPQIALIEEQRAALTKILDGVRDRMRRKELEEEQAVLNRRVLAGAVPARNCRAG